jgi:hypothetical protein
MFDRRALALGLVCCALSSQASPAWPELRGLRVVRVVIEGLPDPAKSVGVTENELRTKVELALRRMGMTVLDDEKSSAPYVYIQVSVIASRVSPVNAVSVNLLVRERAQLLRNRAVLMGATYFNGWTGLSGTTVLKESIYENVTSVLESFENDWRAAN